MTAFEVNFDGLVGPTHNYAGLSYGNLASDSNKGQVSSPKQAALQGLTKMKALADMGLKQAVLPPHDRPYTDSLRKLGFDAPDDRALVDKVARQAPKLLQALSSASCMWVANAATVSPFADSDDGRTHITPANLSSMFHRSIEHDQTGKTLQTIFRGDDYRHHPALPPGAFFADEGAANHTRFCRDYGHSGVELFVYGASAFDAGQRKSQRYPARQTLESSSAIARLHQLPENRVVLAQQNPEAIDAGVFHNDVIAVGNRNLLFFHERAFLDSSLVKTQLQTALDTDMVFIEVPASEVSLQDAVDSYLFNSQLLSPPGCSGSTLLVPEECRENEAVQNYLLALETHPAVDGILYFDLLQSMRNGGGPACLRLRVVMSEEQIGACRARVFLDQSLYEDLRNWIEMHYRDELSPQDLLSPDLLDESRQALDELITILGLGNVYGFQYW